MPWLYRHWEAFHPSYFTFCSPKIHNFLFLVYNTKSEKIRRAIVYFIYLSGRVEGRTHKVSTALLSIKYQRFLGSPEALERVHIQQVHLWFKCKVFTSYCNRLVMHTPITFLSWAAGTYHSVNASCSLLQSKQPNKWAFQLCLNHHR